MEKGGKTEERQWSGNGTNELETAHAIIELAATRKRLARLETAQTNTVTITVTP